jgi:hypothetical protein
MEKRGLPLIEVRRLPGKSFDAREKLTAYARQE